MPFITALATPPLLDTDDVQLLASDMTSSLPKIRSACEECHERKVRCRIPRGGGPCQNCQANFRQCYFLPRFKAGRPKQTRTQSMSNATGQGADQTRIMSPTTTVTLAGPHQQQQPTPVPDELILPPTSMAMWPNSPPFPMTPGIPSSGTQLFQFPPERDTSNVFSTTPLEFEMEPLSIPAAHNPGPFQSHSAPELPNFPFPSMGPPPASMLEMPPAFHQSLFPLEESSWENDFQRTLRSCGDIHALSERLKSPDYMLSVMGDPNGRLQQLLRMVDVVCEFLLSLGGNDGSPRPPPDLSVILLIITTILQILDTWDLLLANVRTQMHSDRQVLASRTPPQHPHSFPSSPQQAQQQHLHRHLSAGRTEASSPINLDHVLMLKKLEVNIVQVRMVLAGLGTADRSLHGLCQGAMDRVAGIQTEIRNVMEQKHLAWL